MEPGLKSNKYFSAPGQIPTGNQRPWTPDEDSQLRCLQSHFKMQPNATREEWVKTGQEMMAIWNEHLRTGNPVNIPTK